MAATMTETPDLHLPGRAVDPRKDDALARIFEGLRRPAQKAVFRRPGEEAAGDAGQPFYELNLGELRIAIRADALKAYVSSPIKMEDLPGLNDAIANLNFKNPELPTAASTEWTPICTGKEPVAAEGIVYFRSEGAGDTISAFDLVGLSSEVDNLLAADEVDEALALQFRCPSAVPGGTIARLQTNEKEEEGRDVFGHLLMTESAPTQPEAGTNVEVEGDRFVATRYGYVVLEENRLSVFSPVMLDRLGLLANWCVIDSRPQQVEADMLKPWLAELNVVDGIQQEAIDWMAHEIFSGRQHLGLHKIAMGDPPIHGHDSELELLVEQDERYGQVQEDGSRNFDEVDFAKTVNKGEEVALLKPPTRGTAGRSVSGEEIPCHDGIEGTVKAGAGTRAEKDADGVVHYYAETHGVLSHAPTELSVMDSLVIEGDVGYETGNLEFRGEIVIKGSVQKGYNVKASGDVIVFGHVDGATIAAGGNAVIGEGIFGRKTMVVTRGDVRAQFVRESKLRAGGDIVMTAYSRDSTLRADGSIWVGIPDGEVEGSLAGGRAWSRGAIEVVVAGGRNASTELTCGVDPEQVRNVDRLNHRIEEGNKLIARQLSRFQMTTLDVAGIQRRLAASTGSRKKILVRAAKQLGEIVQAHQKLLKERRQIESATSSSTHDAQIKATEAVLSGVIVRIGDQTRRIRDNLESTMFTLGENGLVSKAILL